MKAPTSNTGSGGGGFDIPDGSYPAVCCMVIDCGIWTRDFMGESKSKREIYLRWELPTLIIPDGEYAGDRACVGNRYTFSMYKKANLRRAIETWRGRPFSDADADQFDIENLIGQNCTLQLYKSDAGYTNINLVLPPTEKHEPTIRLVFDTENPSNYNDLPEWIKKKVNMPTVTPTGAPADHRSTPITQPTETVPGAEDFDDDIPF